MELDTSGPKTSWSQTCHCTRVFHTPGAYTTHVRKCVNTRKRLSGALEKARLALKRPRTDNPPVHLVGQNLDFVPAASEHRTALPHGDDVAPANDANAVTPDNWSLSANRVRRQNVAKPLRFRDEIPTPPPGLPRPLLEPRGIENFETNRRSESSPEKATFNSTGNTETPSETGDTPKRTVNSECNVFGLRREFLFGASCGPPDAEASFADLVQTSPPAPSDMDLYYPFPNLSSFLLGEWFVDQDRLSDAGFLKLIKIVGHPEFRPEDVGPVEWKNVLSILGNNVPHPENSCADSECKGETPTEDGWYRASIKIHIPSRRETDDPGPTQYDAGFFRHRKFMEAIKDKLTCPESFRHLHFEPFKTYWQPDPDGPSVRAYDEIYTTDEFIQAHLELQNSPPEPNCNLPRVVLALLFSSDTTHFGNFTEAEATPVYMGYGNESKDRRNRPSNRSYEHVAYFEKLPKSFTDSLKDHPGEKAANDRLLAHLNREMRHAQWGTLLDDDFLQAYEHGVVISCPDGISRRFYPRIFIYSADYPEKVLTAGIRNLGQQPCPRCLIPLKKAHLIGTLEDIKLRKSLVRHDEAYKIQKARRLVYEEHCSLNSRLVENLLFGKSLVPAYNAFSAKLAPLGFDIFQALVVDQMHEIESGVWKSLFTHLLRILDAIDDSLKHELDERFRRIPPFGTESVRKTTTNRSELKKMTAHAYENMLQCAIPVFEGLFPEPHAGIINNLLFDLAHYHALAKLELHTDPTLLLLEQTLAELSKSGEAFTEKTCPQFQTRELKTEHSRRRRREAEMASQRQDSDKQVANTSRKPKTFTRDTIKWHSLGDYPSTIRRVGVTGSYSTQRYELEHQVSKKRYRRSNGKSISLALTTHELRSRRVRRIRSRINKLKLAAAEESELLPDPAQRYVIGRSQNTPVHVPSFCAKNFGDPMIKNYQQKLHEHLAERLADGDSRRQSLTTSAVRSTDVAEISQNVHVKGDVVYHHNLMRCYFTTYDVRRGYDVVNARTPKCNVMLLATPQDAPHHPFLYARVLGIYHANVAKNGPGCSGHETHRVYFLWVRWYDVVGFTGTECKSKRLHSLRFRPMADPDCYGFVDPSDILRGCHIVPNFSLGKRFPDGKCLSKCAKDGSDYRQYYVAQFSERDLLMRYHWGLGVGHRYSWKSSPRCDPRAEETASAMPSGQDGEGGGQNLRNDELMDSLDGTQPCSSYEEEGPPGCDEDFENSDSCGSSDEDDAVSEEDYTGI